ncbi:bric-A-brac, putative [Pediculus humanus corporis]|uniref:Bric-A-brac, putative n=1 Tax=Pediculus humanus subsp. corporis TaxID=121224 RepID=E0VXJ9_PEDHC|nr:bric-A-brac, putative [Pediculus humanus corporis]EEB18105.1 bric-A-brac, putative [Pediculus humanus corporis]
MWQKCWNTNQSLVHNLRFRERGPLKSWRPETMAEAIFSVLKEGLSLSQAARKFDIPYPTFVLYANRVHNMLGPSADGGADLRPKGRGRPQRILLGVWPDEHIRGVIRAVVFRDPQHMKEEQHLGFPRLPDSPYLGNACGNNPDPTAAIAAVAHGLRQQMCNMVAAAHHHGDAGLVNSLNLLSHCNNLGLPTNGMRLNSPLGSAHDLRINSPGSRDIDLSPGSSPCNPLDGCAVNLSTTNVNCKTEMKGSLRSSDSKSPPGMADDYEVNLSTRHLSKSPSDDYDDIEDLVRSSPRGSGGGLVVEPSEGVVVVRDTSMPLKVEITE